MSDHSQLSDLCSICYTQKPKYRCPGCKAQTCSLPCYKRHQLRASCNGKRDPTVFVKKSKLATPAGIDQDYNYLKSVERSIEHASRETSDRGVGGRSNAKGSERGLHPESLLQRYLSNNGIKVERAPKGMNRQKTNQTRFTKRQNVLWTVEWIDDQGLRAVQADCLASSSLQESYELVLQQQLNASMRIPAGGSAALSKTKRKRVDPQVHGANKSSKLQHETGIQAKRAEDSLGSAPEPPSAQVEHGASVHKEAELERPATDAPASESVPAAEQPAQSDNLSFYLLKPGTIATSNVLIPLDSQSTLTASLRNQTVLEYPTLYILSQSPELLTAPYLLEEDYNELHKVEELELHEAIKRAGPAVAAQGKREYETVTATNTPIDPQTILDMLKRDVTR